MVRIHPHHKFYNAALGAIKIIDVALSKEDGDGKIAAAFNEARKNLIAVAEMARTNMLPTPKKEG